MATTSLKKNISFQIVYRILTVITPLITSPLISRALGAQTLGVYSATQAYINYFLLFAMLGVENYGSRTIAAAKDNFHKREKLFWNIYSVQLVASIVAAVVYFGSIPFLAKERQIFYVLQGIWLLAYGTNINWFFFGCEEFVLTVKRDTIIKIVTVIAIIILIKSPDDLVKYIIIMAGSQAVSQIIMWFYIKRFVKFQKPKWKDMQCHIRPMIILFIPVLAGSVYHIMDKTMLDILGDETNLGYYYSADKVINIPLGVITAIGTVMLPRISNMLDKDSVDATYSIQKKSVELTSFLAAGIGFGIAAVANEFVPVFFGPGYEPCIQLLYIFVPVLLAKAWNNAIRAQYLIPTKNDRAYINAVLIGAVVNFVLNYFLIKQYIAIGAVIATFVAEFVVLLVEGLYAHKDIPFFKYFIKNYWYVVAGIIMCVVVNFARLYIRSTGLVSLGILIVVGGIVYLCLCCIYWLINKESVFNTYIKKVVLLVNRKG